MSNGDVSPPPMTDARWTHIEHLFDQAADLAADERRAFVDRECGDDVDLRDAVLSLLAHDTGGQRITDVIDAAARLPIADEAALPLSHCGPYRIVREIGRGGMGIVFEAERDDGAYSKRVALKLATRAAYSPEFLHRFREERQILARLEHPHIARLLDGGATSDGIPYFAMELVDGVPIHDYVRTQHLGIAACLRLFLQVCDAVDYAHQNLVIHRDLTPRNILVGDGSVRLLDFGISKLIDAGNPGVTLATLAPFTPAYCSPEQLRGEAVTTRTDVHALGLVLFEILTGSRAQAVDSTSPSALEQAICQTPIPTPSAFVQALGDRTLARRLSGDLDTIVLVATAREPSQRYASVAALGDDVRRYLDSQPIRARQASVWYRATRFARRHWGPLAAAALVIAALTAGIVATRAEARRADRRFQEVRRIANTLMGDVHGAIRDLPASTKAQEVVAATAVQYLEGLARESGDDVALLTEVGRGYTKVATLAFSLSRPSLGRADDARRHLARAREVLDPLYARQPNDAAVATAMTALLMAEGGFLDQTSRRDDGRRSMEEAVRTGERALAVHPTDPAVLDVLLEAYDSLMASFDTSPAALQYAARYLERAEQRAARQPDAAESRAALGAAYSQAGKVAAAADRMDDALSYFRRNADIQAAMVAAAPYNATARRNLMLTWSNLSDLALGPLGLSSYTGPSGPAVEIDPKRRSDALDAANNAIAQADWIHRQDPTDDAGTMDYAVALGRSAPAYSTGDPGAIVVLERGLGLLRSLEARHPDRIRMFLIELSGSLAERHRQVGRMDRAVASWHEADAVFRLAIAAVPDGYYARRLMIPVVQNWALALAVRGDLAEARRVGERAVTLSDEVAARASQYARAPGWPPRTRAWLADLHARLGDDAAAARAREESLAMWRVVAARTDLPGDVTDEAKAAIAAMPN